MSTPDPNTADPIAPPAAPDPAPKTPPPQDATSFEFRLDDAGRLFVRWPGAEEQPAFVKRAFPWSQPAKFLSLRNKDSELMLLDSLEDLAASQRAAVEAYLRQSVFIPRIRRIDEVRMMHGQQTWRVDTDRGPIELRVQEREDVRFLSDTRFSVKDADGNVYEIADIRELDEKSRAEFAKLV